MTAGRSATVNGTADGTVAGTAARRPDPARPMDADRTIMRKAVLRLSDRLPDLADRLTAEILSGDRGDRDDAFRHDVWEMCHTGLGHGFKTILEPSRGRADLDWARRLGQRRAHQGQPLDQLLRSYRLAGRVFWEAVVEVVGQNDPENVPALIRQATRTWDTIDQQSGAAAAAYHRTELALARRSEERVQAIVDALLDGQGADGGLLATATSVLGLPATGRYAVVMLGAECGFGDGVDRRPADTGGMRFIWRLRTDAQVALVALGAAELDDLVAAVRPYAR